MRQLLQVVNQAKQLPLAIHLLPAAQREVVGSPAPYTLSIAQNRARQTFCKSSMPCIRHRIARKPQRLWRCR